MSDFLQGVQLAGDHRDPGGMLQQLLFVDKLDCVPLSVFDRLRKVSE